MGKWVIRFIWLYVVAVLLTAIAGGEIFWGLIFSIMIYAPFYIGAFLPAYTYYINKEIQLYGDLITIAFCLIGLAFPLYLGIMIDYLDLIETFFAALPFTLPLITTLHRRAMGY